MFKWKKKSIKYKTCRISKTSGLISIFNLPPNAKKNNTKKNQIYVRFCGITELTLLKDGLHLKVE